jgi:hypothetical protein
MLHVSLGCVFEAELAPDLLLPMGSFLRPVKDLTDPQEGSSIPHRLIPYGEFPLLDRSGQSYIV